MTEEGGFDPDDTGTFDPNEGASGKDPLLPHQEEMSMKHRTSTPTTSTSRQIWHHTYEETSFGDKSSGVIGKKVEAIDTLKRVFPHADTSKIHVEYGKDGEVYAKLGRERSIRYLILENGEVSFTKDGKYIDNDGNVIKDRGKVVIVPKTIRNALGETVSEIKDEYTKENERDQERIKDYDKKISETAVGKERDKLVEEQNIVQDRINVRNQEIVAIEERLTLRQRIKAIFKKYGFTAFAVATAIGTVIGVIVSNLKAGLTKVAKGVGNGLKELGKKLGEILPGMIGAIASFIFRTAGEVIGFLAKNAWLLIVGLVVLAVEQLKKKSK